MFSFSTCRLVVLVSAACNAVTSAEEAPVGLGSAGDYAILAKTGISTVPSSTITGDIAVSPIAHTSMTGFDFMLDPSTQFPTTSTQLVDSHVYAANYGGSVAVALTTAVSAMETAYTDAAGRVNPDAARINLGGGNLGGDFGGPTKPLTPGVYTFGSDVNLNGNVQFSGAGVYVFQIAGNLKQAANYNVVCSNGAVPEKIFWQVAGCVQVGTGAHMEGIILAKTKVDFLTGSSLDGRILTQTACNLQSATITEQPAATRRGLRSV